MRRLLFPLPFPVLSSPPSPYPLFPFLPLPVSTLSSPFSPPSSSSPSGGLQENPDPAFYQTAWFIVVMFLLVLGLLTGAVVVVCVVRRSSTRGKKKYHGVYL